jgi:hypothetical protein
MPYTVGIQRWPLPLFKKFKVTAHDLEPFGVGARLGLSCADGSRVSLSLGRLDRKAIKVYPDYWVFIGNQRKLSAPAPAPAPLAPLETLGEIPILEE